VKTLSFLILLFYWSVIILAPVLSKDINVFEKKIVIVPKTKPNK